MSLAKSAKNAKKASCRDAEKQREEKKEENNLALLQVEDCLVVIGESSVAPLTKGSEEKDVSRKVRKERKERKKPHAEPQRNREKKKRKE